jgi:protein phosphatase 1 regulatory subunit 7
MPEIVIDGFKFSKWAGERQLLIVESDRLRECVAYCREKQIKQLHISPYHGYHLNDLGFLRECKQVQAVHLQGGFADYSGLYELPHLSHLSAVFPNDIDVSALPALTDLSTDWTPKLDMTLFSAKSLERLWLRGYKPKSRDLGCMKVFRNLADLSVILSSLHSLRGIEMLPELKKLDLSHCRLLEDITPLAQLAETLEELEIDHCKKIKDLTFIRVLRHLRKAILVDSGSVPSLKFIEQMPDLEFLSFVGVNVLDGDMTPCFKLKYAGFLKKRHYSHSSEEVREIISGKTPVHI